MPIATFFSRGNISCHPVQLCPLLSTRTHASTQRELVEGHSLSMLLEVYFPRSARFASGKRSMYSRRGTRLGRIHLLLLGATYITAAVPLLLSHDSSVPPCRVGITTNVRVRHKLFVGHTNATYEGFQRPVPAFFPTRLPKNKRSSSTFSVVRLAESASTRLVMTMKKSRITT